APLPSASRQGRRKLPLPPAGSPARSRLAIAPAPNQLIPMTFSPCGKLRRFPQNPEPNVKQRLLGLAPWGRAIGRNTDAHIFRSRAREREAERGRGVDRELQ